MQNKTRITITLDQDLLNKIDGLVDKEKIRNRSHAIESLIKKTLRPRISQAVILAAGKGVRWRPLTYEIPKALIPMKGKPILEHTINYLRDYNIRNIFVVVGSLGEKIKTYFGNGERFGVNITYIEDKKEKGTAPALKAVKNFIKNEPFLFWYIDEIADINIDDLINFHTTHKALGTVALSSVSDPIGLGAVKLQGPRITEFLEKPSRKKIESYVINAGIFIFQPEVFSYIDNKTLSLEKEVFPKIAEEKKLYGYLFSGKWFDIGTPKIYAQALKEWK
ncbi:ribbon-helix-helix protein, CopG family [bacterium]|nr:MAG: ribbon-helix-helix protein, CopG family [bacterium]